MSSAKLTKIEPYGGPSAPDAMRWTFTLSGEHEGKLVRIITSKQNLTWAPNLNQTADGTIVKKIVRELKLAHAYGRDLKIGAVVKL